ncbi:MAG: PAS domain S-box protein [Phycisphaerae bacterium]
MDEHRQDPPDSHRARDILQALQQGQVDAVVGNNGILLLRLAELERRLQASEARYRGIVEDAVELICRWSPDRTLLFANQAFCEIFAIDREQQMGEIFTPPICPEDQQVFDEHLARLQPDSQAAECNCRVNVNGRLIWLHWTSRAFRHEGSESLEIQSAARDVSQQHRIEQELRSLNESLERKVRQRTAQLEQLAKSLTRAEENERRKLAGILHDGLQQLLVGAKYNISQVGENIHHEKWSPVIDNVEQILDHCIETARTLSHQLSPPILEQEGLAEALEWLADQMQVTHGLEVTAQAEQQSDIWPEAQTFLFRAAQELLLNVRKHAETEEAVLFYRQVNGQHRLVVEDGGSGFDPDKVEQEGISLGLFGIRQRASLLGGQVLVESAPGQGTRIDISIPAEESAARLEQGPA